MTRSELKEIMKDILIDPWNARDENPQPISLYEAKTWLADIRNDQDLMDLEENERIPDDTAPAVFMEIWNEICDDWHAVYTSDDDEKETCPMKKTVVNFLMLIPETDEEITLTVPAEMPAGDMVELLAPLMAKAVIENVTKRLED